MVAAETTPSAPASKTNSAPTATATRLVRPLSVLGVSCLRIFAASTMRSTSDLSWHRLLAASLYSSFCRWLVDDFRIPKSRTATRIFLPSTEDDPSDHDRQRVSEVCQGKERRALARGKRRGWYPVADAPFEVAAVEAMLCQCAKSDTECRLHDRQLPGLQGIEVTESGHRAAYPSAYPSCVCRSRAHSVAGSQPGAA